jgi:CDP-diacylglycerol--glycerol-3-phosphate 3-phosphatidyltransferase
MRWTLPNILTVGRLALLPLVVGLIWPTVQTRGTVFWAAVLYIVAGVLDVVDGYVARRINQVTAIGKFLDPLADKLFHLITLVALMQLPGSWVPGWVVMVVLTRELMITGLRAIASSEGLVIAAGAGGKAKTTFAVAGMAGLLIHYPYAVWVGYRSFVIDPHLIGLTVTYISVAFSVVSGVAYIREFLRHAVKAS